MAMALVEVFKMLLPAKDELEKQSSPDLLKKFFHNGGRVVFEGRKIIISTPALNSDQATKARLCLEILKTRANGRRLLCKVKQRFYQQKISSNGKKITRQGGKNASSRPISPAGRVGKNEAG